LKKFSSEKEKDKPKFIHILRTSEQMNKIEDDAELGGRIQRLTKNQENMIKSMTDA